MKYLFTILLCFAALLTTAQKKKTSDAHLIGHVISGGEHIPYASIFLEGTTIGALTDETGHFQILNVPQGEYTVRITCMGYEKAETEVEIIDGKTTEMEIVLKESALGLDEVVVSANRNAQDRREAAVIVNTIGTKEMAKTNSSVLAEGLSYSPGLRVENNCQNCGFNQVRINGMDGVYSQILINSRPIFSGLAALYGIELIPSNMLERIEVIKGGGSSLYGSNGIAGTVNLILKDPISNTYEGSVISNIIGLGSGSDATTAWDHNAKFNTSLVSADNKTGLAVYGFYRNREDYDQNGDSFSELSQIDNVTVGSRFFRRFGSRSKLSVDFFHIDEGRRGGNDFDAAPHESDITESTDHSITTGAVTYDQFFRTVDILSVYASAQGVNRDSYYGANQDLSAYGRTKGLTYNFGSQYKADFEGFTSMFGIENTTDKLNDKKLGYLDTDNAFVNGAGEIEIPHVGNTPIADQYINTLGIFGQFEKRWLKYKLTIGLRYDHYRVEDKVSNDNNLNGDVLSPRVAMLYDISPTLQARASYGRGYRAPQVFNEDLHIETSGSRKIIQKNAPGLKQETSNSFTASLDYNKAFNNGLSLSILLDGFYTGLEDPFSLIHGEPEADGTVIYTRENAESGAHVAGINIEFDIAYKKFDLNAGFTVQESKYDEAQNLGLLDFERTPNDYGFFTLDYTPKSDLGFTLSGTYTGKMDIIYYGVTAPEEGELRETPTFFDLGLQGWKNFKISSVKLQIFGGIKNIFNSYQSDFDKGVDRDPAYMYGPGLPRTIYLGLKIGNGF
ncbi:MAG: TonB-dependent receptor [Bacteroidales bacterium]